MKSSFILKHEQLLFAELSKSFFTFRCFHYIHYIWGQPHTVVRSVEYFERAKDFFSETQHKQGHFLKVFQSDWQPAAGLAVVRAGEASFSSSLDWQCRQPVLWNCLLAQASKGGFLLSCSPFHQRFPKWTAEIFLINSLLKYICVYIFLLTTKCFRYWYNTLIYFRGEHCS